MKTLTLLSVIQTIAIVMLIAYLFAREPAAQPSTSVATAPAPLQEHRSYGGSVDEERLRSIIREELALHLTAQPTAHGHEAPAVTPRPRDEQLDRTRQAQIEQQIEAYQASGSITDAQMQELQAAIAQLDETGRRQMMSKLIRAMNAGDIKGRL
jgi:MFS superfamily sulfate permease-like transporter